MNRYLIIPDRHHIEESIALSKQYNLGFEFNDFFTPKMLDNKEKCERIACMYDEQDMPDLLTSHGDFFDVLVFSADEKIAEISEMRVKESMEIAKRVHASAVIFHTNYEPFLTAQLYLDNWRIKTEMFFRKICEEYPEINVYMENMFDQSPDTLKTLAERMADVDNFGVCLDYAHAYISKTAISEWVKTLAPYIRHVHINDNDGENDLHLAVGEGVIDWKKFLKLKKEYFPDVTILIETTPLEKQRKSLEFMDDFGFFA